VSLLGNLQLDNNVAEHSTDFARRAELANALRVAKCHRVVSSVRLLVSWNVMWSRRKN